jgi:hypothetical protein
VPTVDYLWTAGYVLFAGNVHSSYTEWRPGGHEELRNVSENEQWRR